MPDLKPFLYREPQTRLFHDRLEALIGDLRAEEGIDAVILDNVPGQGGMVQVAEDLVVEHQGLHIMVTSADRHDFFVSQQLYLKVLTEERRAGRAGPASRIFMLINRVPASLVHDLDADYLEEKLQSMDGTQAIELDHPLRHNNHAVISHGDLQARLFSFQTDYPENLEGILTLASDN